MPKPPNSRKKLADEKKPQLLKAIEFVNVAQKKNGDDTATHVRLLNNWAVAYNRDLVAGYPINETISCCPHTEKLMKALKKVKETLSVTVNDDAQTLEVNCDGNLVKVPTVMHAQVHSVPIDQFVPTHGLNENFKKCVETLNKITKKSGDITLQVTASLHNNNAFATDNDVLIEFWHGLQISDGTPLVVGKPFLDAVAKCKDTPVSIGATKEFVFVYYENSSFIAGFRYDDWDIGNDTNSLFANCTEQVEISTKFVKALVHCLDFSDDGHIYTNKDQVSSGSSMDATATVNVEGVKSGIKLNKAQIKFIKDQCTGINMHTPDKFVHVFGDGFRGLIEKVKADDIQENTEQ